MPEQWLQAIAEDLRGLRHEVQSLVEILQAEREARASVEVKNSPRGVDVTVKAYGPTVREAGESAVDEWLRVREVVRERVQDAVAA